MNFAEKISQGTDVRFEYAEVTAETKHGYLLKAPSGLTAAMRAAGCLLRPEVGDLTLYSEDAAGACFILAVLSRASESPARVDVDGGMILGRPESDLALCARNATFVAGEGVDIATPRLTVSTGEAEVRAVSLDVSGEAATVSFERVRTLFGAAERVVGRFVSRVRRMYRRVDEFEDARYGRLRQESAGAMDLTAAGMRLRAEGNVDVEGKKINLG